jgi:hypothetical protein
MPIKGTYYNATLGAAPTTSAHIGYTTFLGLTTSVPVSSSGTNPGITLTLTPGVWICSYAVRIFATSGSPVATSLAAYMSLASTTNTIINGFSNWSGSSALGALGPSNLALTGCATIVQTTTQTLTLITSLTQTGGMVSYYGDTNPQTYMQATRIA